MHACHTRLALYRTASHELCKKQRSVLQKTNGQVKHLVVYVLSKESLKNKYSNKCHSNGDQVDNKSPRKHEANTSEVRKA